MIGRCCVVLLSVLLPVAGCGAETKVVSYGDGVELRDSRGVAKLKGAPQDFKQYIAGAADATGANSDPKNECAPRIFVDKLDTSGYATGAIFDCGGARLIWARRSDGIWRQIWGGQITPDCPTMERYKVPAKLIGTRCWDVKAQKDVHYPR